MKTSITLTRQKDAASPRREQSYEYELREGMSLLNVLSVISEADPTLEYSHCCDNACCGICAVMCDGVPGLSCRIKARADMRVSPLKNLPAARDLVIDRDAYDARRQSLSLYSSHAGAENEPIAALDPALQEPVKTASRCIECLCCLAVCPIYAKESERFAGPCDFVLIARHALDPRDETDRSAQIERMNARLCVGCSRCSEVCPSQADPARMIRLLMKTP